MAEIIHLEVKTWEKMLADSERLAPVIARVTALYVALWDMDDDDHGNDFPPYESVPGYLDLKQYEREFVTDTAGELWSQWAADSYMADFVALWFSDRRKELEAAA